MSHVRCGGFSSVGAGFRGAGGGSVCGGCVAAGRDVWWAALACWGCLTVTRVCASLSRC